MKTIKHGEIKQGDEFIKNGNKIRIMDSYTVAGGSWVVMEGTYIDTNSNYIDVKPLFYLESYERSVANESTKIEMIRCGNGDSRTADDNVSFEEFQEATDLHRKDVSNVMNILSNMLIDAGNKHDWSKKEEELMFYDQFHDAKQNGKNFKNSEFYNYHITNERHHLLSRCPEDVTIIDVMEMIADCVSAGMTRSGKVFDLDIPNEVLQNAVKNTADMIINMIDLKEK